MNEGTLVPWRGFWAVKDQEPGGLPMACGPAPLADVLGGSVTYGVPSATCPPPVVANAKHVDRGGFLPDPGQLTSPVGMDDDGAPGEPPGRPASHPDHAEPPRPRRATRAPASRARPPRPFHGRTCDVVRSPREISRGERTTSGENLSSGRRLAGWGSENAHTCVRRTEISRGER